MMRLLLASAALLPQSGIAQNASERTVQVTGVGIVQTVPDIANLDIYLRGEGPTPDAATAALSAKQKAVSTGVADLLGPSSDFTTSNVTVIEARGGGCADARGYGSQPRLSSGECAVAGFIATMQARVRTQAVEKAATAAGLASRLGASDARLQGFVLSDPKAAQGRASAAAVSDARQRAEALATGAGLRLGPIVTVHDQPSFDLTVSASRIGVNAPAAPPAPRVSPVVLDTKPTPVETRAQVTITYALLP